MLIGTGRGEKVSFASGDRTVTRFPRTVSTRIWTMCEPTASCPLTSPDTVTLVRTSPTGASGFRFGLANACQIRLAMIPPRQSPHLREGGRLGRGDTPVTKTAQHPYPLYRSSLC